MFYRYRRKIDASPPMTLYYYAIMETVINKNQFVSQKGVLLLPWKITVHFQSPLHDINDPV